jgi:polysaccharide export outer membrane protein
MKTQPTTFRLTGIFASLVLILALSSCISKKKIQYFNDLPDRTVVDLPPSPQEERIIEFGDALDIVINGRDPDAAKLLAKPVLAVGGDPGIIVDPLGNIEFPVLGKVKAYGLTARQLKDKLTDMAKVYIKEPIVDVKFFTFKVSVLGAVSAPGVYTLSQQRTTILDALAMAGDVPVTAKKEDVQLYRDYNGKRSITKIDLKKQSLLTDKETFQLKHNDIIIVQPRGAALFQQNVGLFTTIVGIVISVVSLGVLLTRDNN